MNFSFQNINTNCRNLAQEYGPAFLFIDQSSTQSMDEQERESAAYLLDLLL